MHRPEAQGLEPALARHVREALACLCYCHLHCERVESTQTLGLWEQMPHACLLHPPTTQAHSSKPSWGRMAEPWVAPHMMYAHGSTRYHVCPRQQACLGLQTGPRIMKRDLDLAKRNEKSGQLIQRTQAQPVASPRPCLPQGHLAHPQSSSKPFWPPHRQLCILECYCRHFM